MAGDADGASWEHDVTVVLRQEEGGGGDRGPDAGCLVDLCRPRAARHGPGHEPSIFRGYISACGVGPRLELCELLWLAKCRAVAGLGGLHYGCWDLCSSSGELI